MKDIQINNEIVDIDSLKPNLRNPRTATQEAMERLKRQIQKLGQYKPIIIDTRTGLIVGGHMRYEALQQLGVQKVFVSYITSENDTEAMEYALSDNDNIGVTDKEQLLGIIEELPELKLDDFSVQFDEPETLTDFMSQFDVNLNGIESNEDREKKFKDMTVTCPHCEKSFDIKV